MRVKGGSRDPNFWVASQSDRFRKPGRGSLFARRTAFHMPSLSPSWLWQTDVPFAPATDKTRCDRSSRRFRDNVSCVGNADYLVEMLERHFREPAVRVPAADLASGGLAFFHVGSPSSREGNDRRKPSSMPFSRASILSIRTLSSATWIESISGVTGDARGTETICLVLPR